MCKDLLCHPERVLISAPKRRDQPQSKDPVPLKPSGGLRKKFVSTMPREILLNASRRAIRKGSFDCVRSSLHERSYSAQDDSLPLTVSELSASRDPSNHKTPCPI